MFNTHSHVAAAFFAALVGLVSYPSLHATEVVDENGVETAIHEAIAAGAFDKALVDAKRLLATIDGNDLAALAVAQDLLGQVEQSLGHYDEAESAYRAAIDAYTKDRGADHPDTIRTGGLLADLLLLLDRRKEAIALTQELLATQRSALGGKHPDLLPTLERLAALHQTESSDESVRLRQELLELQQRLLPENDPGLLSNVAALGNLHRERKEFDQAEPYFNRLLVRAEKLFVRRHPALANAQVQMAGVYTAMGKFDKAEELYVKALEFHDWVQGENPDRVAVLQEMEALYVKAGNQSRLAAIRKRLDALSGMNGRAATTAGP